MDIEDDDNDEYQEDEGEVDGSMRSCVILPDTVLDGNDDGMILMKNLTIFFIKDLLLEGGYVMKLFFV